MHGADSAELAIAVEGVGKRYKLGESRSGYDLLSERLEAAARAPARWLGRGREKTDPRPASTESFWALRDVSFELRRGETLGLIGANGAGKSTLLKLMSRITLPSEGRITTLGRIATMLEVGTGFHPELTGRENVYLSGTILGMRRREIDASFDEIVEFSGVERFLDTPVKRYSSGMYVRLAFAIAAHLNPEIMLVDEVLAVGDTEFQKKCLGKMRDVSDQGRAVVFVSHNLNAVQHLCSRAILIDSGRVVMDGDTAEVVTEYFDRIEPEQSGGVAVIPSNHPRAGAGGARLRRASMTALDGEAITSLRLGQPFRISATFEVERAMNGVVEIGIHSTDGQRIATTFSTDSNAPPFDLRPGIREIVAETRLTLVPGDYNVEIAIHAPDERSMHGTATVDRVERVLRFTALNIGELTEDHWPTWRSTDGYVRFDSAWNEVSVVPSGVGARSTAP
jgi:lipopolysaccharide transport system ATP-binding protein